MGRSRSKRPPTSSSSRKICGIESIADVISKELSNYSDSVTYSVKNVVSDVADNLVKGTKKDARIGRRKGEYRKSISSKTLYENQNKLIKVWYVKKPNYRLAHLLNNGHAKKGGGFVSGDNHITNNEKKAIKELEEGIRRAIENGS